MTMPSIDCPAAYSQPNLKNLVIDRVRQRVSNLERHSQRCLDRYQLAQQTIRANEKQQTTMLRQRVQESKLKKGSKCKMEQSRSRVQTINDPGDADGNFGLGRPQLKRKIPMQPSCDNSGYGDTHGQQQHDAKRMKNGPQNMNNNPSDRMQNGNVSVRTHISVNVDGVSSNQIETTVNVQTNRNAADSQSVSVNVGSKNIKQETMNGQQQPPPNHMNQQPNMDQHQRQPGENTAGNVYFPTESSLDEAIEDIMNVVDDLSKDNPPRMDDPPVPQPQRMTSQNFPPDIMTSEPQPHMTSSQQFSAHQSQQIHLTSPLHHHMSPPGQRMTSPMMQQQPSSGMSNNGMVCKREKVSDMFQGFRGNTPENKQENPGMQRQNSHRVPHPNMSANVMTHQAVRLDRNNFGASISSQQNVSVNMMQQPPNYQPSMTRQMSANNNNMTSQHIQRLNQVAQFGSHDPPPQEPPRLFHPPSVSVTQNCYESSAQLRQMAEKSRGMNISRPMNVNSVPRTTQTLPHYDGGSSMSQSMNMMSHPISSGGQRLTHMEPNMYSRSQYMPSQRSGGMNVVMQQQSMHQESIMMRQYPMQQNQQSNYNRVPEPHPQQIVPANQTNFHGNGSMHHSWNSRGGWPPSGSHNPGHHHSHRPQITQDQIQRPHMNSDVAQSNYLPELDNDLNFINEILSDNRNV